MPRTRRYKKAEKNAINIFSLKCKQFFSFTAKKLRSVLNGGGRKLTIMIVPHSQQKVFNFQTTVFALIFGFVLFAGVIGAFFWFGKQNISSSAEIARLMNEQFETRASFDELRDENKKLIQSFKKFQNSLTKTMEAVGLSTGKEVSNNIQNGDLSSFFNVQEIAQGTQREAAEIRSLTSYLENSIQPIEEIGKMLKAQGALFSDIPSIWPVKGGIGHISMSFGQNVHPITGQWYIHKGMDFSTWRAGDPIVATANGQAVTIGFDNGLGLYVIIKHKHGFYTRYAHMQSSNVKKGQFVSQGDIIGRIGNTGVSTGPHLHYEVHIGADVVDPAKFVNVTVASK